MKKTLSFVLTLLMLVTTLLVLVPSVEAEATHSVVMTATEFIDYLQYVVDRGDSRYGSGGEKSIGKYDGKYIYFDCWGLGESIICTKGQIVYNKNTSLNPWTLWDTSCGCGSKTGDWLKSQSELSTDFTNIVPGEWLFKDNANGSCYHVGYYIGNGKVIESTTDGSYDTQITTIDSSGHSNIRGSSWKWTSHGKVPWISYHTCSDFTSLGVCTECGKTYDWQLTFNPSEAGTYMVAKDFTPRTDSPYDAATKSSGSIKKGTSVSVSGSYTNAFGNKWYKFIYDNGKVGYVLHSYLELVNYNNLNVTCTGFTPEENAILPLGQGYPVWGTVSSNYPLKKVVAKIDGSDYATWIASNDNTTSFEINPTDINNSLKFGNLSAGKHTITLIATDAYGRSQTFLTRSFNMVYTSCSHSYSSNYSTDETNHWKVCTKCGSSSSLGAHSYDNSCDTSCNICSATRSITHTYSFECDELCNICGAERTVYDSAHSYKYTYLDERKHTEECTMCGRKTEILHHPGTNVLKYTHYNSNQHWFLCKNCEEYFEYSNHYYSNSCDETCNGCDYTRTISHTYSNACDSSCNVCEATRATSHEYDNVCDTSCNICGEARATNHRYLNACDKTCDVCGAVRNVPAHLYDNDCDTSCNNCGYSRPTSHTYDNNCDRECNVCGATRSVSHSYGSSYLSDNNMHWRQCNSCGYKGYSENHIPGAYATETNPQICIICSFVIQPPLGHITHNYSSQYQKNDSQHWYECICGSKKDIQTHQYDNDCDNDCNTCGYVRSITHVFSNACDAKCNKCEYTREIEHAFDNGTVTKEPTTNEKGEITYICTLCGEKKYQDIDVLLGGNDNLDDNKPVVGETPNDDKNLSEGVDMPTVIAISVSVAAVTATGTALLIRRKNPKPKVVESNNSKEDNIEESISEESESNDGTK